MIIPDIQLPIGSPVSACVDVGGTKVAVTIADEHGIRGKVSEPTAKTGSNDAVALQIVHLINESCAKAGVDPALVEKVAVSSCGPFVLKNGMLELAATSICGGLAGKARGLPNDWTLIPLEATLRSVHDYVRVENDAVAALMAERKWGALQGKDNCAYVTWSTGIGMGLCVDGRILHGKNGNAGHFNHTYVIDSDDALCGCGTMGHVDGLIAGNAIPRRFGTHGYKDPGALFSAAQDGKDDAIEIIDGLCDVMARALFNVVVTLDLERISLGGSVFWHNRDYLLPRLRAFMQGKTPMLTDGVELVEAGLGEQVGDLAALALVVDD